MTPLDMHEITHLDSLGSIRTKIHSNTYVASVRVGEAYRAINAHSRSVRRLRIGSWKSEITGELTTVLL